MRGTLNAAPLLELLTAMRRFRKSGSLMCESASMSLDVRIEHGIVRSVSTSEASFRIGQVLIQLGLTTEERIEQALALQSVAPDPERVGDVLVDVGFIPETAIGQAIGTQISSSLLVMFNDDDRKLTVRLSEPESGPELPSHPASDPLILTAAFLSEYWIENARAKDPSLYARSSVEPQNDVPARENLRRRIQAVLDRIKEAPDLTSQEQPRVVRSLTYLVEYLERLEPSVPHHEDLHRSTRHPAFARTSGPRLELIDREIDIWQLADLTRGARAGLLELLNGERNQARIEEVLGSVESCPQRAITELIEHKLIHQPSPPDESEQSEPSMDSGGRDRTVIMRFLP